MPGRIPTLRPAGQPATPSEADRDYNRNRRDPALTRLYSSARWQRFRAHIRRSRVTCEGECKAEGRVVIGEIVHHLVDPRADGADGADGPALALDPSNVLLVCRACHNRIHKTTGNR